MLFLASVSRLISFFFYLKYLISLYVLLSLHNLYKRTIIAFFKDIGKSQQTAALVLVLLPMAFDITVSYFFLDMRSKSSIGLA